MKRGAEILIFAALAIAVHLAFFASARSSGSEAGGSGGEAMISIQAAAQTVVEMVETWEQPLDTPPVIQNDMPPPDTPAPQQPVLPKLELTEVPRAQMRVAVAQPQDSQQVVADQSTPTPPQPKPEVEPTRKPDTKPKPRPKQKPAPVTGQKADQTSAGRAGQRAAGSGGSPQAGAGTQETATASSGQQAKLQAIWGAKIRARIERNKRFPRGTRQAGDVTLELTVGRDGALMNYRVQKSSGAPALDEAAMGAVARAKRFPKAPKELPGNSFRFRVVMKLQPK